MDHRTALPRGTVLAFPGMPCEVGAEIGRGSNAIVYEGSYRDAQEPNLLHRILVKELFPLEPGGKIYRREDASVAVDPEAEPVFRMHRKSFEAGNAAHLALLEAAPDRIGANLNTFSLNGTLYTLLGVSGGVSLGTLLQAPASSLAECAARILTVLDALDVFHRSGLAHLDIAPDNILLLGSGSGERALLIDYNSAMAVSLPREAGAMVFSIKQGYTAPEIRSGRSGEIGFASDLYSVTAVFFRMLTGKALTPFQAIRSAPPDVSGCPCVSREPETVRSWVQEILRRGLQALPARRYQSAAQMRLDLEELLDRIRGIGITHWALWEAGRRNADRMVRDNPSLSFIRDTASLFPSVVSDGTSSFPAESFFRGAPGHCMLVAGGGMGKTTALLRLALSGAARFAPDAPAVMYLSLYGWQPGEQHYILNRLLDGLRFRPDTQTFEGARKVLHDLLSRPLSSPGGSRPVLLLLLDGLNEVSGDTRPLLDEIRSLASLPGLRLVLAGRAEEAALPFPVLRLMELPEDAVRRAVAEAGLLLPEAQNLQALLRTPLMLSMYLESGRVRGQARISSAPELLQAYLSALKEKAVRDLPEEADLRWQADAAVDLVLPALAAETERSRGALEDRKLLPAAEKCYRLLNGKLSRRFFPQWIGHTAAIRGGARNAEEWYGQVVHRLLWKQLGLLVRDPAGRYLVTHQVIAEYLLDRGRANQRSIRRYHRVRGLLAALCACLVIAGGIAGYRAVRSSLPREATQAPAIALSPYDGDLADMVMSYAASSYYWAAAQNERLRSPAVSARDHPDTFPEKLAEYQSGIPYRGTSSERMLACLDQMLASGEAMPWSGIPMDESSCRSLMSLPESLRNEYELFGEVLAYVMTDDYAFRHYGTEYPALLASLLDTDAEITAGLYQLACVPHQAGKYADPASSMEAELYWGMILDAPVQNSRPPEESLADLRRQRNSRLAALRQCGAFYAYEKEKETTPE